MIKSSMPEVRTFESRNSAASFSVNSVSPEMLTTKSSEPSMTDWRGTQQLSVFIMVVQIIVGNGTG